MKTEIIGKFTSIKNNEIATLLDNLAIELNVDTDKIIEVVSASDEEIQSLNKTYRSKDETTDVLSFPIGETVGKASVLGTIVISESYCLAYNETVSELIKHGFLHLIGFDHEENEKEWLENAKKINHKMY